VANHFPVLPQMQLSAVGYEITFADIAGPFNSVPAGDLSLVNWAFQRGADDTGTIQFDYSGFDQDTYEAGLKNLLNQLSGVLAGNLGVVVTAVRAAMSVNRHWFFYAAAPMADGTYAGYVLTDLMPYP